MYRVLHWPGEDQPTESAIRAVMGREGLRPYIWSNAPGDHYGAHTHSYDKVIYVVDGSIMFDLPDVGEVANLEAGDRLDLKAGVAHGALVGPRGVVCLEAHR